MDGIDWELFAYILLFAFLLFGVPIIIGATRRHPYYGNWRDQRRKRRAARR